MILKILLLYIFTIVLYRFILKKEVIDLNILDLTTIILITELLVMNVIGISINILIIPIIELLVIQVSLDYVFFKNKKIKDFIEDKSNVIIKNGKLSFNNMNKLKYKLNDLINQLRKKDIKSIEEVEYATLKENGNLSILKSINNHPLPIILNGIIDYDTLEKIDKDTIWIHKLLIEKNLKLEDIYYAFYNQNKTFIITKSDLI